MMVNYILRCFYQYQWHLIKILMERQGRYKNLIGSLWKWFLNSDLWNTVLFIELWKRNRILQFFFKVNFSSLLSVLKLELKIQWYQQKSTPWQILAKLSWYKILTLVAYLYDSIRRNYLIYREVQETEKSNTNTKDIFFLLICQFK